jgi:hypothetical protein
MCTIEITVKIEVNTDDPTRISELAAQAINDLENGLEEGIVRDKDVITYLVDNNYLVI